jgi:peroxiredoxin
MAALQPGSQAPDFTLASHLGDKVSLTKGRKAVVAFLPFAFTGG